MDGFSYRGRVGFADTDAAGIVHFTNILRYVERAEAEWLQGLGLAQYEVLSQGTFRGFPKVRLLVDYQSPLLPGEDFCVQIHGLKHGRSSLSYHFEVFREKDEHQDPVARGEVTLVYSSNEQGGKMKSLPLPPTLFE